MLLPSHNYILASWIFEETNFEIFVCFFKLHIKKIRRWDCLLLGLILILMKVLLLYLSLLLDTCKCRNFVFFFFVGDFKYNLCVLKLQERKEFLILSSGMLVLVLLSHYLLLEAELFISLKVTVNRSVFFPYATLNSFCYRLVDYWRICEHFCVLSGRCFNQ